MAGRVCPPWIGFLMLNPLRKLGENPNKLLGPYIREGMTVLEPGCAMGFFTLPMAKMVGPTGRVVAVEVQQKMLSGLERRARRAGLLDRLELRLIDSAGLGLVDMSEQVDFTTAIHMVHEVPDQAAFFADVFNASKPGAKLLVIEPKGHVSAEQLARSVGLANSAGFVSDTLAPKMPARAALLAKPT